MRTTVSFEADVAKQIERLARDYRGPFKSFINEILRAGLRVYVQRLKGPKEKRGSYTKAEDLGRARIGNLDNLSEVLAIGEGDAFK